MAAPDRIAPTSNQLLPTGSRPHMAAGRRRHDDHPPCQTARHVKPARAHRPHRQKTHQGGGGGARQQERAHRLGDTEARRNLREAHHAGRLGRQREGVHEFGGENGGAILPHVSGRRQVLLRRRKTVPAMAFGQFRRCTDCHARFHEPSRTRSWPFGIIGSPGTQPISHSPSFVHLLITCLPLTAIANAFFCPTKTTSRLPRVIPV